MPCALFVGRRRKRCSSSGRLVLAGGSAVTLELSVDRLAIEASGGHEPMQQAPAKVGVEGEASEFRTLRQRLGDGVELGFGARDAHEGSVESQLVVAARVGRCCLLLQVTGELGKGRFSVLASF